MNDRQLRPIPTSQGTPSYGGTRESALSTNRVLRNTYLLLSATLLFSAAMAGLAMAMGMPYLGPVVTLVGYFGLLFLTYKLKNSAAGIAAVFALTGFMGLTLGPILSMYVKSVPNGGELIMTSLGITGLLFAGLSAYVLKTGRDMSFMGGFLTVGMFGLLGVIVIGLFVDRCNIGKLLLGQGDHVVVEAFDCHRPIGIVERGRQLGDGANRIRHGRAVPSGVQIGRACREIDLASDQSLETK